ncbi:MAG: hypothetical protein AAF039_10610 [Bacteroidota bacterium]
MNIDNGEIIFFNHGDESAVKEFVKRNKIIESNKTDVWELLCNQFLDTELEPEEIAQKKKTLERLGISITQQQQIAKRIKWSLFGTWEWTYLGHWDVLAMKQRRNPLYRINGSDFYWWTMEIAGKRNKTNANKM